MPPDLVKKLNTAFTDILKEPETRAKLQQLGYELTGTSAEDFTRYLAAENEKWAALVKAEGSTATR